MDFTPIIPTELNGNIDQQLLIKAEKVCTQSAMLVGTYNINIINELKILLRKVNSYYSNKIESEGTHPIDIEKAMRREYLSDTKSKNLQLLSLRHIKTQDFVEKYCDDINNNPYSKEFILDIHREFYSGDGLDSFLDIKSNETFIKMIPGKLRKQDVSIGNHISPSFNNLIINMDKFTNFYKPNKNYTQALKLIYALSSHHRLVWIHPFLDGNGRTSRLALDGCLVNMKLEGYGLWNISRGLARDSEKYKYNLALADTPRLNDLDGRGVLSTREFKKYVNFMLDTALDQVLYMKDNLQLSTLGSRIESYVLFSQQGMYKTTPLPKHSNTLFKELLISGEIARGEVKNIIGTKDRIASSLIKDLINMDYLKSDTPRGKIRINFNAHFATQLFPELIPSYT